MNQVLNIVIGLFIWVFVGNGIYRFWDFRTHPDFYAMQSAPQDTGIMIYGVVTMIVVAVSVLTKRMIRRKLKKSQTKSSVMICVGE